MAKITWDDSGKRFYETGVSNGVLYVQESGKYPKGVAWNGLISVSENPSGAEASAMYADNTKYLELRSNEEFGATIQAYTYPDEFGVCDGSVSVVKGLNISQQGRKTFGLAYKTLLGNDTDGNDHGYKLHLVYGAVASPSQKQYSTVNNSPEAIQFSWEITTTPVAVEGYKPTSILTIDSSVADKQKLKKLEDMIFGTDSEEAKLPLPTEVIALFKSAG